MRSRVFRATLPLLAIFACSAETLPPKGQLMVVVSTNLAPPKDFDKFVLRIFEDGKTEESYKYEYDVGSPQATKLPATLGIVAGSDPNRVIRVSVEALRGGKSRLTRDAVTRVPSNRIASLPLPLDGLCVETSCPNDANGKPQTCIAGSCQTAEVDESKLADFSREAVFGGGTGNGDGACFDTLSCFSRGAVSEKDADCTIAKELGGSGLNVAVVQPPQSDGVCAPNGCLIPLDKDPFPGSTLFSGWREANNGRIALPKGVCERSLVVMSTVACPTKSGPTCGPWSAVGSDSTFIAPLPIDGSVLGGDAGLPPNVPAGISFVDADVRERFVKGTVTITRAPDESTITGYRLYWADGPTKKQEVIATLPKTGANVTHLLDGAMLAESSHLIAVSYAGSDIEPAVSTGPIDNFVQSSKITVNSERILVPEVLLDTKTSKLLFAGWDTGAGRTQPSVVRCSLDGTGCTWTDISAGQVHTGPATSGAVLDTTNDKLLVVINQSSTTPGRLFRCNTDGSSCTFKDLGEPATGATYAYTRIPLTIDETNKKLVALIGDLIYRCDLDGNNCTYPKYGEGAGLISQDGDVIIDKAGGKLLVAHAATGTAVPYLFRCELDGTSCGVKDVSAGDLTPVSSLSIAIDEKNQKLIIVTYRTNGKTLQFYRCNLDGTACITRPLDDPALLFPSRPHVLVDAIHEKIFVFFQDQAAAYQRCELDGTGCTSEKTMTGSGGYNPRAVLHEGTLYTAGAGSSAGFDFAKLRSF